MKFSQHLKQLGKHFRRNHPNISMKDHRYLKNPSPQKIHTPKYMKYRKKSNKTLLLPHLKTTHTIFSREEYDKESSNMTTDSCSSTDETVVKKYFEISPKHDTLTIGQTTPRKTLHEAMLEIEKKYVSRLKSGKCKKTYKKISCGRKSKVLYT